MHHDSAAPRSPTPAPPSPSQVALIFHALRLVTWSVIGTCLNTTELSPQSMLTSKTSNTSESVALYNCFCTAGTSALYDTTASLALPAGSMCSGTCQRTD